MEEKGTFFRKHISTVAAILTSLWLHSSPVVALEDVKLPSVAPGGNTAAHRVGSPWKLSCGPRDAHTTCDGLAPGSRLPVRERLAALTLRPREAKNIVFLNWVKSTTTPQNTFLLFLDVFGVCLCILYSPILALFSLAFISSVAPANIARSGRKGLWTGTRALQLLLLKYVHF